MLVTLIFKKGGKCLPEKYRAISLLSIPGKVLNKILLNKIREKTELYTSNRQYGLKPNRSTVDVIIIARQLMKKAKEGGIKCPYSFVDFKSAFDIIWTKSLMKMVRSIGINKKIVSIVEKVYGKTNCAVVDGLLTEWFSVSVRGKVVFFFLLT